MVFSKMFSIDARREPAPTAFCFAETAFREHTTTYYIIIASCDNFGLRFIKQQFWEQPEAP